MAKPPRNRAHRRREQRKQALPSPSFWASRAAVVLVGVLAFLAVVVAVIAFRQTEQPAAPPTPAPTALTPTTTPDASKTPATPEPDEPAPDPSEQLKIEDIKVGTGPSPKPGDRVTVHYTGRLTDGTEFDSSVGRNQPFTFTLGAHDVIPGWEQGVATMKVGGKRKLTVPLSLGYGSKGKAPIPPNSTLVFDIEFLKVEPSQ